MPDSHSLFQPRGERSAVEALLPHRDPFLFVDSYEQTDGAALAAQWKVPADADWFRGHYPGQPVLPGVLLCEHALQAGAILVALILQGFSARDGIPVVTRIENARFRRMVRPGDLVETRVRLVERVGPAFRLEASVRSEGARAADVACVLTAADALARATGGGGTA